MGFRARKVRGYTSFSGCEEIEEEEGVYGGGGR